jgi:hypothetical protein
LPLALRELMMKTLLAITTTLSICMVTAARAEVDANHPDLSDQSDKFEYDRNPAWYSKGWHDGWVWASALPNKSQTYSDDCEKICRQKYGDIDEEGSTAEAEFSGFLAAAAFVREHDRRSNDRATGTAQRRVANSWDACPGGWVTQEAIKQLLDNPNSCNFDSATEPQLTKYNGKECWLVVVQFRTKNPAGAEVITVADVYMIGGEPTSILDVRLRE